jgi:dihydrofolate reductase
MSLDGYIAGPEGASDWIVIDPDIDFHDLFTSFDTILLGRKTYEVTRQAGGGGGVPLLPQPATLTQLKYVIRAWFKWYPKSLYNLPS